MSVASANGFDAIDQRRRDVELAGEEVHGGADTQGEGQDRQGPGIASELDLARGEHVPAVVVPDDPGHSTGEPRPTQAFFVADAGPAERIHCLL